MTEKINLLDLKLNEIEELVAEINQPRFRAKQIFSWLKKGVDFSEMKNLPKDLISKLSEIAYVGLPKILKIQESKIDGTRKYLLEFKDGNAIETVFMKYKFGNSICVSSQAGCRMGCKFCASTIGGLNRNLTAGEIYSEILAVEKDTGERISHVVVMGTGEPFDNYDNLSKFIELINCPDGLNIGMRNITVSTCGIIPMIEKFGTDFPQVNLAISLHQWDNERRSELMPVNKAYPLNELIDSIREYTDKTSRRITFEYTLVKDNNDSEKDATELARLLKGLLCHVNLIPLNTVKETGLLTTEKAQAEKFKNMLEKSGIPCTIRRELGDDIDAACGQLRLSHEKN